LLLSLATALAITGCSRPREYELEGQILAVDATRREVTIRHGDIKGFMPGMTMPFKVRDVALLEGRVAGDMIKATLVVDDSEAHLRTLEKTGHAPVVGAPPKPLGEPLSPGDEVPETALVDDTGTARRLREWRGRAVAVTFIYTRCPIPDFCPLMDRHFAEAQQLIANDAALRGRVGLVSVSFDPQYDTPAVLATHAKKVNADPAVWTFLTGAQEDVDAFASRFGVSVMREGTDPANVVHNLRTAVVDGNGRLVKILTGMQWAPSELVVELGSAAGGR
jgi:protein SCO1/2